MEYDHELLSHAHSTESSFKRLHEILSILRSPEGCPWDRKQTIDPFFKNLIEETYEYIDSVQKQDVPESGEELGDIYLVLTMLGIMHEEQDDFSLQQVLNHTCDKLIRRHPHVFGDDISVDDADGVVDLWDSIKENVEGKKDKENMFSLIPSAMPPLERAEEIQKKAHKKGFDWPSYYGALEKIREEVDELHVAINEKNVNEIKDEIGDLLFSVVNVARLCDVPAGIALHGTNEKFIKRYNLMIELFDKEENTPFSDADLDTMDIYWEKAKKQLKHQGS
jgi:MazG family protein